MSNDKNRIRTTAIPDQIVATVVKVFNDARSFRLDQSLDKQDGAFADALTEVENVLGFLRDPSGQLGSPSTKHGEIAEVVEIGIRRARDYLNKVPLSIHDDGISRTGPVDYILDGHEAQSKFINGVNSGLRHVEEHMDRYQSFIRDGGIYVIPKDQYDTIQRVLSGDTEGMSAKTVSAIRLHIEKITAQTDRPVSDVIKPSISMYSDVQPGTIESTMERHQEQVEQHHERCTAEIHAEHQASLAEGLTATATAAAVGATIGFANAAFRKYKEGKNIFQGDFDKQDWRDVGADAFTGSAGAALSGAAIYLMTNCAEMSAPLAGAFVAAVKGIRPLVIAYSNGSITKEELVDAGLFVCSDVALVGICTAAGQTLVPVPVLGAMIGSLAGKCLSSLLTSSLNAASDVIEQRLQEYLKNLDASQQSLVTAMVKKYEALGNLASRAFETQPNLALLQLSVQLANDHQVPKHLILHDESELDEFMRS